MTVSLVISLLTCSSATPLSSNDLYKPFDINRRNLRQTFQWYTLEHSFLLQSNCIRINSQLSTESDDLGTANDPIWYYGHATLDVFIITYYGCQLIKYINVINKIRKLQGNVMGTNLLIRYVPAVCIYINFVQTYSKWTCCICL